MADSDKPKEGRAESPTTARELDFDDDEPASHPQTPAKDVTHASTVGGSSATPSKAATATTPTAAATAGESATAPSSQQQPTQQQTPSSKPMSAREEAELTLQEAFPSIEGSVVKAVLAASGGQVEPAFNALLGMSDPESAAQNEQQQAQQQAQRRAAAAAARVRESDDGPPPPQPPRPAAGAGAGGASQMEADELYARQLAEHYERQDARAMARERQQQQARGGTFAGQQTRPYTDEDRERNFIDDDLPEIGENIRKGFLETQQKFSGWLNTLKKRIDGDEEDDEDRPQLPARRQQQAGGPRRSHDYEKYDADPEEFGNDFSKLQLRDETASATKQPGRRANPDLFKPTPATPHEGAAGGRRVSFQEGPPEEIGVSTEPSKTQPKSSKWQPLSTVEPSPVGEHDPFSLGDSDDDEAAKTKKTTTGDKDAATAKASSKDAKADESNLLEKATAEAMAGEIGDDSGPKLELKDNAETKDKK